MALARIVSLAKVSQLAEQALGSELGVTELGVRPVGVWVDGDAAPWDEQAFHLDVLRLHELYQVIHDDVRDVLVEVAVVAETEQVQFQLLALDHQLVGDVVDEHRPEIGLAGYGAERREFGTAQCDQVVAVGMGVLKRLENRGVVICGIRCLRAENRQVVVVAHGSPHQPSEFQHTL